MVVRLVKKQVRSCGDVGIADYKSVFFSVNGEGVVVQRITSKFSMNDSNYWSRIFGFCMGG